MATLTGVLLDVSRSMKINAGGKINEKGGEWARSIFDVIDNLIKHDVSNDNYIFSVGVGANGRRPFFDVIETVKEVQHRYNKMHREKNEYMDMQRKEKLDMEKDREMNLYIKIKEEKSLKSLDTEIQREMSLYMELQREKNLFIWEKTLDVEMKRDNSYYIAWVKKSEQNHEKKKEFLQENETGKLSKH
ncbi:Hypothetical predicted protein [Mytilus galloprovincialis]|uniref:Uncharacterized protein n=1 Tax=Mytilus galloprovincialis TaxID=29158 RepID=A0A8B6E3R3_MYTGA|nr:Hypothetical predicted protein [Mytilus galloprovincialis]